MRVSSSAILSFCAIFMSFPALAHAAWGQNAVRTRGNNRLATAFVPAGATPPAADRIAELGFKLAREAGSQLGLYNERLRPRRLQIGAFLRQNLWNSLRRGRLGIEKRQLEKAKTVAQRGCDVAKHEAERQALF